MVISEGLAWGKLRDTVRNKFMSAKLNQGQYEKIFDLLDAVAIIKGIEIAKTSISMLASLKELRDQLDGDLGNQIEKFVEGFKIRELLAKIPLRLKFEAQLEEFDSVDTWNLEKIREVYAEVIPQISSSGKLPHPSVQKYIDYFQDLSLQATDNRHFELIRSLDLRLQQQQKEIDELKELVKKLMNTQSILDD